jgi:hypothetical protein
MFKHEKRSRYDLNKQLGITRGITMKPEENWKNQHKSTKNYQKTTHSVP